MNQCMCFPGREYIAGLCGALRVEFTPKICFLLIRKNVILLDAVTFTFCQCQFHWVPCSQHLEERLIFHRVLETVTIVLSQLFKLLLMLGVL